MKSVVRIIGWSFLVIILLLIAYRFYRIATKNTGEDNQKKLPVTVLLEDVHVGKIADTGAFTGTLEADSTFMVSPKAAGRITEVNFKLGDKIHHGDVVARLDDREQRLSVQEEQAALLVAQASVDSALAEVDKADVEIHSCEANVGSARAQIASAEVAVQNAKVELKSTLVKIKKAQNNVTSAENAIASDEANLAGEEAQLNLMTNNLDREKRGFKDDTSTQADLDAAQAAYDVQKANVRVAQSKLNTAKNNLAIAETEVEMAENDRDCAQSKVNIAESDLTIAKTNLVNAQAKVENAKTAKVIAEKQVIIAREQVKKQEAVLSIAQERQDYTVIKAIWKEGEGASERYVSDRLVEPGALVAVNTNIISIVDTSKMTVAVTAIEKDFARLRVGQAADVFVQVSMDGNPLSEDNRFRGVIIRKSPVIDNISRQGRFEIEIDNKEGKLHPGAFARIEITYSEHENSILVPPAALCQRDDRDGIFLKSVNEQGEMVSTFVPVTVGIRRKNEVEIIPQEKRHVNVLPHGQVVTIGNHLLKEGTVICLPVQQK